MHIIVKGLWGKCQCSDIQHILLRGGVLVLHISLQQCDKMLPAARRIEGFEEEVKYM